MSDEMLVKHIHKWYTDPEVTSYLGEMFFPGLTRKDGSLPHPCLPDPTLH